MHASDVPLVLGLVMILGGLACLPAAVKRARTRPAPSRKQRLISVGRAVAAMVVGAVILHSSR